MGAIQKKLIFSFVLASGALVLSANAKDAEEIKCLFVNHDGVVDATQSAVFGKFKTEKRPLNLFGLQTNQLEPVLVWEAKFVPSFLETTVAELKTSFVFPLSGAIKGNVGLAFEGTSKLQIDEITGKKVQKSRSFDYIDQENKKNEFYGYALTPEQEKKISEKFIATPFPSFSTTAMLATYKDLEEMSEPLSEIMPSYIVKYSEEQKNFLAQLSTGKIAPEYADKTKYEQMLKSVAKAQEVALEETEPTLFNLAQDLEDLNVTGVNAFLYVSDSPYIDAKERLKPEQRLYLCSLPAELKVPMKPNQAAPKAEKGSEAPQEDEEPKEEAPKKKPKSGSGPSGFTV